jgi:hypothetical protein
MKSIILVVFVVMACLGIYFGFYGFTNKKGVEVVGNKKVVEAKGKVENFKGYVLQGHDKCYSTYYILKVSDDKEYRLGLSRSVNWANFHKHSIMHDGQRVLEVSGYLGEYNGDELILVVDFRVTDEKVNHPNSIDLVYSGERLEKFRNDIKVKFNDNKLREVLSVGNKDYETIGMTIYKNRISIWGTKVGVYPPKAESITLVNSTQTDFNLLLSCGDDFQKLYNKVKE